MPQGNERTNIAGLLGGLLGRRDWAYFLALLIPLAVYNLALKTASAVAQEGAAEVPEVLKLVRSDLLFNLGYVVFWIGMFAVFRRGVARGIAVVLFHAASLLMVTVTTVAYQYLTATGSTLDYGVIVFYLGTLGEIKDIITSTAPAYAWFVLATAFVYVILGPWTAARLLARRRSLPAPGERPSVSRPVAAGLCLMAAGLVGFSLFPATADANRSFSLSPPVNVLLTGFRGQGAEDLAVGKTGTAVESPVEDVKLRETPRTEKRNVVLISLESTRARSVTPYNEGLETTPFLDELSKKSIFAERAYSTFPHTSKALTSINCGIYPDPLTEIREAEPGGIPARCLPTLLSEQGYNTAYFQSATEKFEDRPQLTENFGYGYFQALEDMDKTGFERAGYLGYEDDIMLEPSRNWLRENGEKGPLLAMYDTITPHHEYLAPDRYGRKDFAEDDVLNRYLNSVRYVDFFVKNLMDQYKALGLYEDTVFVIVGDHGEAFGEHGVKGHDGVPYEEGLKIPLMIIDPERPSGQRIGAETPVTQMDIVPTLLDILGYETAGGDYPGKSMLDPLTEDRIFFFNCRPDPLCTTRVKGYSKYIYNYGTKPDEVYDLREDPLEEDNLVDETSAKELERWRTELQVWRSDTAAMYDERQTR